MDFSNSPKSYHIILTIPINFYYYFFIVPFRFKWNGNEQKFSTVTFWIQKVICGLIHLTFLSIRCWRLVNSLSLHHNKSQYEQQNPLFSHVGKTPATICMPLIVTWISWKCRPAFSSMSAELKSIPIRFNSNNQSVTKTSWKISLVIVIICVAPFAACAIAFKTEVLEDEHYNILSTYFLSCLDISTGNRNILFQLLYYSKNFIFYVFMFISQMLNVMFETFGILLVTNCLVYVNWFQWRLEECDDIEEAYSLMRRMKNFISLVNDKLALGLLFLLSFVDSILVYAQVTEEFLFSPRNENIWAQALHVPFLIMTASFWIMAAEINRKIQNATSQWIGSQQEKVELSMQSQVRILGIDNWFDKQNIGVSCTFFVVTYAFLGSMVGLLITFTLIANQSTTATQKNA